jgi:hypothetical protein
MIVRIDLQGGRFVVKSGVRTVGTSDRGELLVDAVDVGSSRDPAGSWEAVHVFADNGALMTTGRPIEVEPVAEGSSAG